MSDANKSNKPVNGKMAKHIKESFEQRDYNISYENISGKEDYSRLTERLEAMEKLRDQIPSSHAEYPSIIENIGYLESDLDDVHLAHAKSYNNQLANTIGTYSKTRNINERTTKMSGQQRFFRGARSSADLYAPTETIEERIQSGMAEASSIGMTLAGRARGLGVDEVPDSLKQSASRLESVQEEIALNKRLLRVQSKEGLSTEKRQYSAAETMNKAGNFLSDMQLKSDVAGGKYGSLDTETAKLSEMFNSLTSALQRFEEASENATDAQGNLTDEYKEASAQLDRLNRETDQQRKVVGEVSRQGGGGGFFGKYGGYIQMAGMVGGAISSGARATNTIFGDQEITQINNKAAFAAMGNSIYGKAENAIMNNDVDAAFDVLGSDIFSSQFAMGKKSLRNKTAGIASVTDILTDVGTNVMGGAVAGGVIGAVPGAIIGGTAGLVRGLAGSVPQLTNLMYGNEGADAAIRGNQAYKQLTEQERKIRTGQMQDFYSQGIATYNSTMGLGNLQSYSMQGGLMNAGNLRSLSRVGVSASMAAGLTSQLLGAGTFDSEDGMAAIRSAGLAGQRGQMSREGYMSAAARMMSMGGSNSDLQEIIEVATARGMDNSKNITQMVDATAQMSAGLGSIGVSGVGAASGLLNFSAQSMVDGGVNRNLAIGAAATSMQNMNASLTNQGFNLGNVMERQRLRNIGGLGGASVFQLNALSSLSMEEMALFRSAEGGDASAMKEAGVLARRKGLDNLLMKDGKFVKGTMGQVSRAGLESALLNAGAAGMNDDIVNRASSGQDFTAEQRAIFNQIGVDSSTVSAMFGGQASKSPADMMLSRLGIGQERLGASRQAQNIAQGEAAAGALGPGKAFENIEKVMQSVAEAVSPEKFADVVKGAAEDFAVPVAQFGNIVNKDLREVLNNVVRQQQQMLNAMGENPTLPSRPK